MKANLKFALGVVLVLALCAGNVLLGYASTDGSAPVAVAPIVLHFEGASSTDATDYTDDNGQTFRAARLGPSKYPVFQGVTDNCILGLSSTVADWPCTYLHGQTPSIQCVAAADVWHNPVTDLDEPWHDLMTGVRIGVDDQNIVVTVPPEYRKSGKMLITWTARVIGQSFQIPVGWAYGQCEWNGSVDEFFKGGLVQTRLMASTDNGTTWKQLGTPKNMTIPDGQIISWYLAPRPPPPPPPSPTYPPGPAEGQRHDPNVWPWDPTHTGTAVVTPADYNGELPASIRLKVQWKNDISQALVSYSDFQSVVVTLTRGNVANER